jgi:ATP-dependent Clp protease ATP-binding subunit ClpB
MRLDKFTVKAQEAVQAAQSISDQESHQAIEPEHLLLALIQQREGVVGPLLGRLGARPDAIQNALRAELARMPKVRGGSGQYVGERLRAALERAQREAERLRDEYVSTEHLLIALAQDRDGAAGRTLGAHGVTAEGIYKALVDVRGTQQVTDPNPEDKYQALQRYSRDLTAAARKGKLDPVIGRDEEIRRVIQVLSRRTKNNPVLIGEPGVGKTAIVEGLAQRVVAGDVPEGLKNKRVVALDIGAMLAGSKYRGEFEDRWAVLKNPESRDNHLLHRLHTLVGAGAAEGAVDAANMLKPALARGELRCVGATTLDEYRKHVEKDAALERRFQPVLVREPSVEDTIAILRGLKDKYEVHHKVTIRDAALVAAAVLSHRYIADRFLPDKAIDLVDEAAARIRIQIDSMPQEIDDIERRIMQLRIERVSVARDDDPVSRERLARIDAELAELTEKSTALKAKWQTEKEGIAHLGRLKEEIDATGQSMADAERRGDLNRAAELRWHPAAWNALAALEVGSTEQEKDGSARGDRRHRHTWPSGRASRHAAPGGECRSLRWRARRHVISQDKRSGGGQRHPPARRLSDPNRPIGSFLLLGPTGVGKTELARALAEFLFDDERAMVRIDMSEYMEKHTVARLIGAPPGYVGYDEGGQLTEAVRRRPYAVVLFDEIEKAHGDVFNVLLQLLDDGRLTDGHGRTVDFRNVVVIMTSNLGSHLFRDYTDPAKVRPLMLQELRNTLRPEFLNRIDEVVVFRTLDQEQIAQIVDIQLESLRRRLAAKRIELEVTDAAKAILAREGYDPTFGARPLKRTIQRMVENPLAVAVLGGQFGEGDHIVVDVLS